MYSDERIDTMSPRGGTRTGAGRKPKPGGSQPRRIAVSISLMPEERDHLAEVCAQMEITQSDFVRLALEHAAVLAVLRKEAPAGRKGEEQ